MGVGMGEGGGGSVGGGGRGMGGWGVVLFPHPLFLFSERPFAFNAFPCLACQLVGSNKRVE